MPSEVRILSPPPLPARVAQMVEHFHGKEKAIGSSPIAGSITCGVFVPYAFSPQINHWEHNGLIYSIVELKT